MLLTMSLAAALLANGGMFACEEENTNRRTTIEFSINQFQPSTMRACTDGNTNDCGVMPLDNTSLEQHPDFGEVAVWYSTSVDITGFVFFKNEAVMVMLTNEEFGARQFFCEQTN